MTIASLLKAVIYPDPRTLESATTVLKPGDRLTGRVAEIKSNGKVLIDFGRLRVLADTDLILHPGEKIRVRVEEIGEQIKLKQLLPAQPEVGTTKSLPDLPGRLLDRLYLHLPASIDHAVQTDGRAVGEERMPIPVRQALLSIRNFLQPPLETIRSAEIAMLLKSLVEHSGYFFEKRMERFLGQQDRNVQSRADSSGSKTMGIRQVLNSDLKSNLLILKNFLDDPSGRSLSAFPELEDLKSSFDRLLAGIQRQQHHFRTHPLDSEMPPAFTVFFHLKKTRQKGMLKVFMGKRTKKGGEAGTRISVLLSMDRIGEIQSDLFLLEKSLQVTFHVEDEKVKRQLEKVMDRFSDVLMDHFANVKIDVRLHHKLQQALETHTAEIFSDRQIDLRV